MKLTNTERAFLTTLAGIAEKLLDDSKSKTNRTNGKRARRSSAEAAKLQKQIRAARRKKMPVREIAEELGVTTSYIYQMGK